MRLKHRRRRKTRICFCPVCDGAFTKENPITRHHVFPVKWYKGSPVVAICNKCHGEFNKANPMKGKVWTERECLKRFYNFCLSKGKIMFLIYPDLAEAILPKKTKG